MVPRRFLIESAAVAAIGTVIWLIVYNPFIDGCCESLEVPLLILFAPAIAIAWAIGGGFDHATRIHVLVGIIAEVAIAWLLVRGGIAAYRHLKRRSL